jgi:xylose isomerase
MHISLAWIPLLRDLEQLKEERYSSYKHGIGADILNGKVNFKDLERYALENDQIKNASGRQEMLEGMLNKYILEA